jgi:hypothetical protein
MKLLSLLCLVLWTTVVVVVVDAQRLALTLVNAVTNVNVGPFSNGTVIDVAATPSIRVEAAVKVFLPRIGVSVSYILDGVSFTVDNTAAPAYTMTAWKPTVGAHTLKVLVHRRNRGRGRTLASTAIAFDVINKQTSPIASPTNNAPVLAPAVPAVPTANFTKISTIQGTGAMATNVGATVTISAIVTSLFSVRDALGGFFVQEEDVDADSDPKHVGRYLCQLHGQVHGVRATRGQGGSQGRGGRVVYHDFTRCIGRDGIVHCRVEQQSSATTDCSFLARCHQHSQFHALRKRRRHAGDLSRYLGGE